MNRFILMHDMKKTRDFEQNLKKAMQVTSSIPALAAPYSSRALSTTFPGSPNLSAILIAFERPAE